MVEILKKSWNQIEEDITLLEEVAVLIEFERTRPKEAYPANRRLSINCKFA